MQLKHGGIFLFSCGLEISVGAFCTRSETWLGGFIASFDAADFQ
jgi:hypothetical protein